MSKLQSLIKRIIMEEKKKLKEGVIKRWKPDLANGLAATLKKILKDGLPDAYVNFDEYMYDFWPDLHWDDRLIQDCAYLLKHHGKLIDAVGKKFKYDLRKDLEDTINGIEPPELG